MKNTLAKDVMIPVSDYITVKEDDTLMDLFQRFEETTQDSTPGHRDAIVVDAGGAFKGKVTMTDIFKALEPNYKKLFKNYQDGTLTKRSVLDAVKDLNLWIEPIQDLCQRGAGLKISEVMHVPDTVEILQEDDSLEKALHTYVMGGHQPLVVKNGDAVTGVLRFSDLFDIIKKEMLACPVA